MSDVFTRTNWPRALASRSLWRTLECVRTRTVPYAMSTRKGRDGYTHHRSRKPERSTLPAATYVGIFGRRMIIINRNRRRCFFCIFGVFYHIVMSSKQQPVVTHYNDISYCCRTFWRRRKAPRFPTTFCSMISVAALLF